MKKLSYKLLAGLVFIVGNSALAYSADEHATEAEKHLEKSVESGNKGDAAGAASHANEAEQHIIEENAKTPYTQPPKHIAGEDTKADHDKALFGEIEKAKGHGKKGHAKEAADSAKKAETHLKEKEQTK